MLKFHLIFWCDNFAERHSFCRVSACFCRVSAVSAIRPKLCGNCAFPQNFHTNKLGEISVFYASWTFDRVLNKPLLSSILNEYSRLYSCLMLTKSKILRASKEHGKLFWFYDNLCGKRSFPDIRWNIFKQQMQNKQAFSVPLKLAQSKVYPLISTRSEAKK